jgi:flagellar basal body-associated protein FliL
MQAMPKRKGVGSVVAVIAIGVAVLLVVMWAAGIGPFSSESHTQATTTAATEPSTSTVKITAFNPEVHSESRAYFVSLRASIKATQAQINRQERVVKDEPSVANQTVLVGLRQNCATVVVTYDASAQQIVSAAFRSVGLPAQIPPGVCSK